MSVRLPEPIMHTENSGHSAAMTFESLAERLREGPLRTMITLHVRAGVLAADPEADHRGGHLQKLVELVQLARIAMSQFHDFTLELQSLIDHVAAAQSDAK